MILNNIKTKLQTIDNYVFYGTADSIALKDKPWNYIVFNRDTTRLNQTKGSFTDVFSVHVIRENFVPEAIPSQVINKMLEIAGMRISDKDATYEYTMKPNTNTVIEIFSMDFVRARKNV